jgi:hypothetical protein
MIPKRQICNTIIRATIVVKHTYVVAMEAVMSMVVIQSSHKSTYEKMIIIVFIIIRMQEAVMRIQLMMRLLSCKL